MTTKKAYIIHLFKSASGRSYRASVWQRETKEWTLTKMRNYAKTRQREGRNFWFYVLAMNAESAKRKALKMI